MEMEMEKENVKRAVQIWREIERESKEKEK